MKVTELDRRSVQLVLMYPGSKGQVVESTEWFEANVERIIAEMEAEADARWTDQPRWLQLPRPVLEWLYLLKMDIEEWISAVQRKRRGNQVAKSVAPWLCAAIQAVVQWTYPSSCRKTRH